MHISNFQCASSGSDILVFFLLNCKGRCVVQLCVSLYLVATKIKRVKTIDTCGFVWEDRHAAVAHSGLKNLRLCISPAAFGYAEYHLRYTTLLPHVGRHELISLVTETLPCCAGLWEFSPMGGESEGHPRALPLLALWNQGAPANCTGPEQRLWCQAYCYCILQP